MSSIYQNKETEAMVTELANGVIADIEERTERMVNRLDYPMYRSAAAMAKLDSLITSVKKLKSELDARMVEEQKKKDEAKESDDITWAHGVMYALESIKIDWDVHTTGHDWVK
jgi:uncharacterized protein YtpQ (UPF0354 family)